MINRQKKSGQGVRRTDSLWGTAVSVAAGSVLFGIAVSMLLVPASIVTGGATGIATVLSKLTGLPVGTGILAVNLPLFALSVRDRGFRGMARAIIGTLCTSVSADFFSIFPPAASDPLLCALVGGAVMGVGAGIMLGSGVTTGGSDLAAYLLRKKLPAIPTGRLILYFDTVIILAAAIALGSLRGVMYSVVCTVAYSAALDMVQSAARRAKTVFIISREYAAIADAASSSLDRGTTLLRGIGWHTGEEWNVVMCVIAKQQEYTLREIVRGADPSAFIVICDASCVLGEGFMHGDDE